MLSAIGLHKDVAWFDLCFRKSFGGTYQYGEEIEGKKVSRETAADKRWRETGAEPGRKDGEEEAEVRLSDKTWRLTEWDRGGRERRDSDNSEVLSPDDSE